MPQKTTLRFLVSVGIVIVLLISTFLTSHFQKEKILGIWDAITPTPVQSIKIQTPSLDEKQDVRQDTPFYPVVKVVDGDTIVIATSDRNETIRLIGIDTPESVDPRRPVECFGKEASEKARELLLGRNIQLLSDPTQTDRDKYNRLLRYVFRDDGLFLNKWLIEEGYAYEYTYAVPYRYQVDFKAAEQAARLGKKGLWNPVICGTIKSAIPDGFLDKDCKDFQTHKEAQEFYETAGGPENDQHKLDANKDGLVCESLP